MYYDCDNSFFYNLYVKMYISYMDLVLWNVYSEINISYLILMKTNI